MGLTLTRQCVNATPLWARLLNSPTSNPRYRMTKMWSGETVSSGWAIHSDFLTRTCIYGVSLSQAVHFLTSRCGNSSVGATGHPKRQVTTPPGAQFTATATTCFFQQVRAPITFTSLPTPYRTLLREWTTSTALVCASMRLSLPRMHLIRPGIALRTCPWAPGLPIVWREVAALSPNKTHQSARMAGPTVSMHAAQNGRTIIDKEEILRITGGALDSHEALSGPIYLQGGEAGHVAFRNITITPAK